MDLRDIKVQKAAKLFQAGKYAEALSWLESESSQEALALRERCHLRAAEELMESDDLVGALRAFGQIRSKTADARVAHCCYDLMKRACSEGDVEGATRYSQAGGHSALLPKNKVRLINLRRSLLTTSRRPTATGAPEDRMQFGSAHVDGFGSVAVLGRYGSRGKEGELTKLIHRLKRSNAELDTAELTEREATVDLIGAFLAESLRLLGIAQTADIILPIPADPERRNNRGFSAPELIAEALSDALFIPCFDDVIRKVRTTRPLSELDYVQRQVEMANSIAVDSAHRPLLVGLEVLLVDDVVTWGTTVKEISRVLHDAGARKVTACAVATGRQNFAVTA